VVVSATPGPLYSQERYVVPIVEEALGERAVYYMLIMPVNTKWYFKKDKGVPLYAK
jgi:hypothetical protein